jgi:hypothetical protein
MDPVTMIVTAVAAGAVVAARDVTAQVVKDGYTGFKALIVRKFGDKPDVLDAVEEVEKKPDSKGRQETLKEELAAAGAGRDADLVRQAQALLDLLKEHGLAGGTSYRAEVHGSGAVAQGPGAVAAGEGGIAVGGNVEGGIHVPGRRSDDAEDAEEGDRVK